MERSTQFALVCDFKIIITLGLEVGKCALESKAYHEVARISKCFLWLYPKRNSRVI